MPLERYILLLCAIGVQAQKLKSARGSNMIPLCCGGVAKATCKYIYGDFHPHKRTGMEQREKYCSARTKQQYTKVSADAVWKLVYDAKCQVLSCNQNNNLTARLATLVLFSPCENEASVLRWPDLYCRSLAARPGDLFNRAFKAALCGNFYRWMMALRELLPGFTYCVIVVAFESMW